MGRDQSLDLLGEDVRHLVFGLDVPVVAAAGLAHGTQELLIELGAESDAARRDTLARGASRQSDELRDGSDAPVRHAVGEEHHAVRACDDARLHVFAALEPAGGEISIAARLDALDRLSGGRIARGRGTKDRENALVKHRDGEPILRAEQLGEAEGGAFGRCERQPGHRAGAVEHEGDIDGRAARRSVGADRDEETDLMGVLGGEESARELDVRAHRGASRVASSLGDPCDSQPRVLHPNYVTGSDAHPPTQDRPEPPAGGAGERLRAHRHGLTCELRRGATVGDRQSVV